MVDDDDGRDGDEKGKGDVDGEVADATKAAAEKAVSTGHAPDDEPTVESPRRMSNSERRRSISHSEAEAAELKTDTEGGEDRDGHGEDGKNRGGHFTFPVVHIITEMKAAEWRGAIRCMVREGALLFCGGKGG